MKTRYLNNRDTIVAICKSYYGQSGQIDLIMDIITIDLLATEPKEEKKCEHRWHRFKNGNSQCIHCGAYKSEYEDRALKLSKCCNAKITFIREDNFQVCTNCKKQCDVITPTPPKSEKQPIEAPQNVDYANYNQYVWAADVTAVLNQLIRHYNLERKI